MAVEDRQRWQRRHQAPSRLTSRESVRALPRARHEGARALDLACGQGRHAEILAGLGYLVVAMDVSTNALHHARARMASRAASDRSLLAPVCADADQWPFAAEAFDLILQVDFLDRSLFPHLRSALRPGGLLMIDTFLDQGRPNAQGPSRPEFLLAPDELPSEFGALEIVHYEETAGETARARFLGRKP